MSQKTLSIQCRSLAWWLIDTTVCLTIINVLLVFIPHISCTADHGLGRLLSMGNELSLPTWYAVILLFVASQLLAMIALVTRTKKAYWWALSGVFLFLSMDEGAAIHEMGNAFPTRLLLGESSLFGQLLHYSWMVVYTVLLCVLVLIFWRFLQALDRRARWLFVFSAFVFVGGALGFESLGSLVAARGGEFNTLYNFLVVIEETLELLGVSLFIYALADYSSRHDLALFVRFTK